jgi:hypothetical protein
MNDLYEHKAIQCMNAKVQDINLGTKIGFNKNNFNPEKPSSTERFKRIHVHSMSLNQHGDFS